MSIPSGQRSGNRGLRHLLQPRDWLNEKSRRAYPKSSVTCLTAVAPVTSQRWHCTLSPWHAMPQAPALHPTVNWAVCHRAHHQTLLHGWPCESARIDGQRHAATDRQHVDISGMNDYPPHSGTLSLPHADGACRFPGVIMSEAERMQGHYMPAVAMSIT